MRIKGKVTNTLAQQVLDRLMDVKLGIEPVSTRLSLDGEIDVIAVHGYWIVSFWPMTNADRSLTWLRGALVASQNHLISPLLLHIQCRYCT